MCNADIICVWEPCITELLVNEAKKIKVQPVHQKAANVYFFLYPVKGIYTKTSCEDTTFLGRKSWCCDPHVPF